MWSTFPRMPVSRLNVAGRGTGRCLDARRRAGLVVDALLSRTGPTAADDVPAIGRSVIFAPGRLAMVGRTSPAALRCGSNSAM